MDAKIFYDKSVAPFLELARPFNAVAALLSFSVGYLFYAPMGYKNLWIGLVVVLLLHSSMTIQNDLHDRDVDASNKVKNALLSKSVTFARTRQVVTYLIALALVIASLSQQKLFFLIFIASLCIAGWTYNAKPLQFSRRPVSSIILLGGYYAFIPALSGLLLSGNHLSKLFILFLIVYSILRSSISMLKDYKDVSGDKKHHKLTFLLAYGHKTVYRISIAVALIAYPLLYFLVLFGLPHRNIGKLFFVPLGIIVLLNCLNRMQLRKTNDNKKLTVIFRKAFAGENYFNIALITCLALR